MNDRTPPMLLRAMIVAIAACVGVLAPAAVAVGGHEVDEGWVHTGVSSEDEARAYPCPEVPAGGWERTGPVVCLAKKADTWKLQDEAEGGCSWYPQTGWTGSCVFDIDMGDHIRVWGTKGISYTQFTVDWGHAEGGSDPPEPVDGGSGSGAGDGPGAPGGPGGPSFPDGPGSPEGPSAFTAPDAPEGSEPTGPGSPDGPDDAPDAPTEDGSAATDGAEPGAAAVEDGTAPDPQAGASLEDAEAGSSAGPLIGVLAAALVIGAIAATLVVRRRGRDEGQPS